MHNMTKSPMWYLIFLFRPTSNKEIGVNHVMNQNSDGISCSSVFEHVAVDKDGNTFDFGRGPPVMRACSTRYFHGQAIDVKKDCVLDMSGEQKFVELVENAVRYLLNQIVSLSLSLSLSRALPLGCVCSWRLQQRPSMSSLSDRR